MRNVLRAVAGIALLSVAACTGDGVGPSGSGLVEVQLSGGIAEPSLAADGISLAPPGSENIASATIEIGAVELVSACADSSAQDDSTGDGDGDCEFVTVTDSAGAFDLMDFQNGLNASLGTATVPVGTYTQIRLHVLSASVTLVDGVTFPDSSSSADLIVPSGAIKINLSDDDDEPGLTVGEGEFVVLLELDVSRNFVLTGPPGSPNKCLFTPVVRQVTGE